MMEIAGIISYTLIVSLGLYGRGRRSLIRFWENDLLSSKYFIEYKDMRGYILIFCLTY